MTLQPGSVNFLSILNHHPQGCSLVHIVVDAQGPNNFFELMVLKSEFFSEHELQKQRITQK